MKQEDCTDSLKRLHVCSDFDAFGDIDIAIEAVPENEMLKKNIMKQLEKIVPSSAILASNTSSISITRLGSAVEDPTRVVGMHFMQPVPVMKLVELIRGHATSEEVFSTTKELAER